MAVEQGGRGLYNRYDAPSSQFLALEQQRKVFVEDHMSKIEIAPDFEAQGDRDEKPPLIKRSTIEGTNICNAVDAFQSFPTKNPHGDVMRYIK